MTDFNDPEVQKAVKAFVNEMDASMIRAGAEKDFQKEAIAHIIEKYELGKQYKKILKKMATTYHRSNYNTVKKDEELFQEEYERIFGVQSEDV